MRQETVEVNLFRHNGETGNLLQIETCGRGQVSGGQEVLEHVSDVFVASREYPCPVVLVGEVHHLTHRYLSSNFAAHILQVLLQSLLEDLTIQKASQQDFLVLKGIGIVLAAASLNQSVELTSHEEKHAELFPSVLQVNQNNLAQEVLANLHIAPINRRPHDDPELFSKVLQGFCAGGELVSLVRAQQQLHTIREEGVLAVSNADELVKDFAVVRLHQRLQHHDQWHEVFVFPPRESERDIAVVEVMKHVCLGGLIRADAANLHTEGTVGLPTFGKGRTHERHGVVSALNDQHSYDLFDTVNNEVTAKLFRLLFPFGKIVGRQVFEVAAI